MFWVDLVTCNTTALATSIFVILVLVVVQLKNEFNIVE